ncbi:amidohydrolase [Bifidobacterium simiarum]|uniref:Amidohydrolase n=1 Tax=Bifidobacterium simiarum TaxID=2045441 RepID=A0A2M9HGI3_9BIFI|nr:amidohydrolase [Bifidobacterium simiarum]
MPGEDGLADVTVIGDRIAAITPAGTVSADSDFAPAGLDSAGLAPADFAFTETAPAETIDADGRWMIPGLWDGHTHFTQWASTFGRLDLLAAGGAREAMAMLRDHLAAARRSSAGLDPHAIVVGMRFRHSLWSDDDQPTLAMIDEASDGQPVALSSADMHCGWVNSAAAQILGVQVGDSGLVGELEWFDAYARLGDANKAEQFRLIDMAERDAASKGVVGICDYEMAYAIDQWTERFAHGLDRLRVRVGVYPEYLDRAIGEGWHGGDEISCSRGLAHVTTLKLISDGSLNTRSAYCSHDYTGITPPTRGTLSYSPDEIARYMGLAHANGFDVACHAIGDEANHIVLDAFEHSGATGAVEHAQLLDPADVARFARLGLTASVQPQHAMDDRDVIPRYWADMIRDDGLMPYAFRSLHEAGVPLRFGSDAPVAVLDPWVAIAAAVYRTDDDRAADDPGQTLDIRTAVASSTFERGYRPSVGDPADLVLLDADPFTLGDPATGSAEALRSMPVAATMCAGRWTHFTL